MGLLELFLSVLVSGISILNAVVPAAAFRRIRDPRFLLLAAASGCLAGLGLLWTWSELPLGAPAFASVELPTVLAVALAAVLLLLSTLVRRSS